jgi:transcriptional regulator with XRE-family HTH domain
MNAEKIGKFISRKRKMKNLTQKELANKLHITDKAVSKWERGLSLPDISVLIPLSEILNVGLYDLLKGANND